jgi:hypothetical protein
MKAPKIEAEVEEPVHAGIVGDYTFQEDDKKGLFLIFRQRTELRGVSSHHDS